MSNEENTTEEDKTIRFPIEKVIPPKKIRFYFTVKLARTSDY